MTQASFHSDDPLLLNSQLSADERAVRDAAAAYSQDRLAPRVLQAFREGTTVDQIFVAVSVGDHFPKLL